MSTKESVAATKARNIEIFRFVEAGNTRVKAAEKFGLSYHYTVRMVNVGRRHVERDQERAK